MGNKTTYKTLRLILGDQLNINHSWFNKVDDNVLYVMFELKQEQEYVKHHIQKIALFFKSMREFKETLEERGHHINYFTISSNNSTQSFVCNLVDLAKKYQVKTIEFQSPDEYRLSEHLKGLNDYTYKVKEYDTEHFYTTREELADFFKNRKTFVLESFYEMLRKKHQILVDKNNKPIGGKWNFDEDNRNKIPKNHNITELKIINNDVSEIISEIDKNGIEHFGSIKNGKVEFPVNREQSLEVLNNFLEFGLPFFGKFQDAMTDKSWRIYHSLLSFSLNVKLISPKEVINQSVDYYFKNSEIITIAQIEGFVRQILGWREYVRGIYWLKMPNYSSLNYFNYSKPLPSYYWDGKTKLKCVSHSTSQSLNKSYAHHIQRLMVLGNFALLTETNPNEVDDWYLGVYADAIEWVQLPNTRGMSQFSDGGIMGTKPYVSSANYIHKMSDYCDNCYYDRKKNYGDKSCPFNSLYWNFIDKNEDKLKTNRRMSLMYAVWNKKCAEEKENTLTQAAFYLENVNSL